MDIKKELQESMNNIETASHFKQRSLPRAVDKQASVNQNKLNQKSNTNKVYVVKKILDHRIVNGKSQYLIQWLGYDFSYDTWEPVELLSHAGLAIHQYYQTRAKNLNQNM